MHAAPLTGGCLCGAVRYSIESPIIDASRCHCRSCRRAAGADCVSWLTAHRSAFALTQGRLATFASSPGVERGFCAACGTSVTYAASVGEIDVAVASLDDPESAPPRRETWASHRLPWTALDPALPCAYGGVDGP